MKVSIHFEIFLSEKASIDIGITLVRCPGSSGFSAGAIDSFLLKFNLIARKQEFPSLISLDRFAGKKGKEKQV